MHAVAGGNRDESAAIQFLENPIGHQNPDLGRAFEAAVSDVLAREDMSSLRVRFNVWYGDLEGLRFVCQIDYPGGANGGAERAPWRWWSLLVATPQQLRSQLREAVRDRCERLERAAPLERAAGRGAHVRGDAVAAPLRPFVLDLHLS